LVQVLRQGAVGVIPKTEVIELAPDLLGPIAGRVGVERKFGIRFRGFGRLAPGVRIDKMVFGDGD
jgi:hypothetical protein